MQTNENLEVGDVIFVKKGVITHVGVITPFGILENSPGSFESTVTLNQFTRGREYGVRNSDVNPRLITERARRILTNPKRYNLLTRNCEHTVTEVLYGYSESPQLTKCTILAAFILILANV